MAAGHSIRLDELTSPVIRSRIAEGWTTVILPLGATEQHGPHLPLCTDTEIATRLAEAVAERLGHCFVAPTIPLGCSAHHMAFAGSISLNRETLAQIIVESCRTLGAHGFVRILVISGHAGNVPAMKHAMDLLPQEHSLVVEAFTDWGRYRAPLYAVGAAAGLTPARMGSHAGHYESSLMLRMRPDLVQADEFAVGFIGEPADAGAKLRGSGMHNVSAIGVIGDPTTATAAFGDQYFEAMVGAMVEHFSTPRQQP